MTKLIGASSFTAMGMWGLAKKKSESETGITTKEVVIAKADALFEQGKYKEIYDLLSHYRVNIFFYSNCTFTPSKTFQNIR